MTTPSAEELRELDQRAQSFVPEVEERRPSTFLSLAPATSNWYPQPPKPQLQPLKTQTNDADSDAAKRRSSSLGSDGVRSPTGLRILKLGPVHYGEHGGEHKGDWHDVAVE